MNVFIKRMTSDSIIFATLSGSIICTVLTVILWIFFYPSLPPYLPLFNQMPWGVTRLGTKNQLGIPLSVSFITTIINMVFVFFVYEKTALIARIVSMTSFLVSLFVLLFTIRLIQIIT